MMYKRLCFLALALCLLLALTPLRAQAESRHVLLILNEEGSGPAAQTAAELRHLALYGNWNCRIQDVSSPIDLTNCERVILCIDEGMSLPAENARTLRKTDLPIFVIGSGGLSQLTQTQEIDGTLVLRTETESHQNIDVLLAETSVTLMRRTGESLGGSIFVGAEEYPLCHTVGHITHLAYFDASSATLCSFLSSALQLWSWPYENAPISYGQYLVLDNVYPFDDPARLMEIVDMLESESIPYALTVMPLYNNAEYPTMKRFCEFLTYVQSKGAGIILHVPLVTLQSTDAQSILEHLEIAYQAYTQYGVYPLAVEAPEVWLQSEEGLSILGGIRTLFLYASDEPVYGQQQSVNLAWKDGHQLVASAREDALTFTDAYAQAIYLDINQGVETLRQQVQQIKRSRRTLKSLLDMENVVYMGNDHLRQTREAGILFNDKPVDTTYYPFTYEEDYEYDRGFVQNLTEQIENGNHLIMLFVIVACSFFILSILLARRSLREELILGHKEKREPVRRKETPL